MSRADLLAKWQQGWEALFGALSTLTDEQLQQPVTIRGQSLTAIEALHRSLAHVSYHVGQIVYIAKSARGPDWTFLSIPPGKSAAYNRAPTNERAASHAAALSKPTARD